MGAEDERPKAGGLGGPPSSARLFLSGYSMGWLDIAIFLIMALTRRLQQRMKIRALFQMWVCDI